MKIIFIKITISVLIVIISWTLLRFPTVSNLTESSSEHLRSVVSEPPKSGEVLQKTRTDRERNDSTALETSESAEVNFRKKQLAILKQRWSELKYPPDGVDAGKEMQIADELSKESAQLLLCSEEAVELMRFLAEKNTSNTILDEVNELFKTDFSGKLRELLVSLPNYKYGGPAYRQEWSVAAGASCSPEEFKSFYIELKDADCMQQALFGYNQKLAKSEPVVAISSTVRELNNDVYSVGKRSALVDVLRQLPPISDFRKIEEIITHEIVIRDSEPYDPAAPFNGSLSALYEQWAKVDPSAVANSIITSPRYLSPSYIEFPAREMLQRDLAEGIEWIQTLPAGVYFDTAVEIAAEALNEQGVYDEAKNLASKIGDPVLRAAVVERVSKPFVDGGGG